MQCALPMKFRLGLVGLEPIGGHFSYKAMVNHFEKLQKLYKHLFDSCMLVIIS